MGKAEQICCSRPAEDYWQRGEVLLARCSHLLLVHHPNVAAAIVQGHGHKTGRQRASCVKPARIAAHGRESCHSIAVCVVPIQRFQVRSCTLTPHLFCRFPSLLSHPPPVTFDPPITSRSISASLPGLYLFEAPQQTRSLSLAFASHLTSLNVFSSSCSRSCSSPSLSSITHLQGQHRVLLPWT